MSLLNVANSAPSPPLFRILPFSISRVPLDTNPPLPPINSPLFYIEITGSGSELPICNPASPIPPLASRALPEFPFKIPPLPP